MLIVLFFSIAAAVAASWARSLSTLQQHPPDAIAAGNELEFIVARCVSELPIRQREVLVLSVYEGFSTEEIAHALQTTAANVYSTLNVARSKLRARLEKYLNMASERVIP